MADDDDAARRAHRTAVFANRDFTEGFASTFRQLITTQEVKLGTASVETRDTTNKVLSFGPVLPREPIDFQLPP